jgi:predicted molibdopterin-dependent oxidoreductase YjgC
VSGTHRAPYCMMGACFDCLVEIDGIPNQQACQTLVREGMRVNLQKGARDIDS